MQTELSTLEGTQPGLRTRLTPAKACLDTPVQRLSTRHRTDGKIHGTSAAQGRGEQKPRPDRGRESVRPELTTQEGIQPVLQTNLGGRRGSQSKPDQRLPKRHWTGAEPERGTRSTAINAGSGTGSGNSQPNRRIISALTR